MGVYAQKPHDFSCGEVFTYLSRGLRHQ
jgi:hypothetical protein